MPEFFCNIFFYNSDSWRRYFLKCICCCVQGKVGELVQPGGSYASVVEDFVQSLSSFVISSFIIQTRAEGTF